MKITLQELIEQTFEPIVIATVIIPKDYLGPILQMCQVGCTPYITKNHQGQTWSSNRNDFH